MKKLKILFVCSGNICRSPLAQGIFQSYVSEHNLSEEFELDSCGTSSYHVGSLPDKRSIDVARKYNISLSHRARQINKNDLDYYDYILVMDHLNYEDVLTNIEKNLVKDRVFLLRSFDPATNVEYNVPDPYYGTDDDFEEVFIICKRSIEGFINYLISEKLISI